jgi:hypothetical protein
VRSRSSLLLGILSAGLLAAACSSAPPPLGPPDANSAWCAPGTRGHTVTFGVYTLKNHSSSPVTIANVTFPKLVRLTATRAYLTPILNRSLIGEAAWPPTKDRAWALRWPAEGGVIKPGQTVNLVFGLTPTSSRGGWTPGPLIGYSSGGSSYSLQEQDALAVDDPAPCN